MTIAVDPDVWGRRAASIGEIEDELARLRRGRSAHQREQVATVARAAVVNIVIVATREIHARRAARAVADLALRHPSRAVVVLGDRDAAPGGASDLALYAQVPSIDRFEQVHFEQILIRTGADVSARLGSVVIPLLVPDLPVFLWWTGTPPIGRRDFEELVAVSDRLVVDSADFARPELILPELSRACILGAKRCSLTDLDWPRVTCWRELVTQFFDAPAWRPWLERVDGVRIGSAVDADGRQIHPSQALLLVGWLASRLGWSAADPLSPSEAGGHLFAVRRPDGARVQVRIRPRHDAGMASGDVAGVHLEASHDGHTAAFHVRRSPTGRYATARVVVDGATVSERNVPLASNDVVALLGEELTIMAGDRVYEDTLAFLLTLS